MSRENPGETQIRIGKGVDKVITGKPEVGYPKPPVEMKPLREYTDSCGVKHWTNE